jgi:hypothetical protein
MAVSIDGRAALPDLLDRAEHGVADATLGTPMVDAR